MPFNIRSSGSYYAIFDDSGLSANRTYTLPNASGALLTTNSTASFAVTSSYALSFAGGAPTAIVTKTADETVTNSTTLQDDDHLEYALVSGRNYYMILQLLIGRVNTGSSGDLKVAINGNSMGYISALIADSTSVLTTLISTNADVPRTQQYTLAFKATTNHTMKVRWAQNSLSPTGTRVFKGSKLIVYETE